MRDREGAESDKLLVYNPGVKKARKKGSSNLMLFSMVLAWIADDFLCTDAGYLILDIGSRQQFTQVVNICCIYPKDGDRNETLQNTSTLIQFGETRKKSNDVLTVKSSL